jgi:Sensors of blue-light using FAD
MLSHLVYVSVRNASCSAEEIEKILASCKKNNGSLDITGVLLHSATHFVQYLEGDYKQIISLYDKIKSDTRHKNVVLISGAPIKSRLFPSWQMGSKKVESEDIQYGTDMNQTEVSEFKAILGGKGQEGSKAIQLIKKFFK